MDLRASYASLEKNCSGTQRVTEGDAFVDQTNRFGKFIRSKYFAVLFFVVLLFANWFAYKEICAVLHSTGHRVPGRWLLLLMLSVLALYEVVRNTESTSCIKKWILHIGGLYVSFFLYWVLSLLFFQLLALVMEWVVPYGMWDTVGFCLASVCAFLVCFYGIVHAHVVVPVHYSVAAGEGEHIYRIVLLSDLHIGIYNGTKHLKKVIDAVNDAQPDMVVIAGDLFDGSQAGAYFDQEGAAAQFRRIQIRNGVVFATGNHDPATTDPNLRAFLRASNISMLNDYGLTVGRLVIFGRNDGISVREPDRRRPLQLVISGYQHYRPMVVVDHNPQGADEAAACGADLVLCGHTHRGQMFPINLFTKWAYGTERFWGHHQLGKTHVIVSAGCGVFQLPVRVGTDNEVVSIDLIY